MKNRNVLMLLLLTALSTGSVVTKQAKKVSEAINTIQNSAVIQIASIDTIRLLKESKEGKELETVIKDEVQEFESYLKQAQGDLIAQQTSIKKQARVLSKEALRAKQKKLQRDQRDLQREVEDKREILSSKIQRQHVQLREKQLKIANKIREEKGWLLMVEKNAPSVLGIASNIDKTDEILAAVNEDYHIELAAAQKQKNKTEKKSTDSRKA